MKLLRMEYRLLAGIALVALPLLLVSSAANSADRDYQVIIQRNPFGLRPPPAPPKLPVIPAGPQEEVFLTGITSIGVERAYFMVKPRTSQTNQYYSLAEGDQTNGLQLVAIDPRAKTVLIRHAGTNMLMSFESNGVKPATTSPSKPGIASAYSSRLPTVSASAYASTGARFRTIPVRPIRAR